MRAVMLVIAIMVGAAGGAAAANAAAVRTRDNLVCYAIHFGGGNGPDAVTADMLDDFYEEIVAPRFPSGATIHHADGRWFDPKAGRMIKEKTFVVEVEGNADATSETEDAVTDIANEYLRRYGKANAACFIKTYQNTSTTLYYTEK